VFGKHILLVLSAKLQKADRQTQKEVNDLKMKKALVLIAAVSIVLSMFSVLAAETRATQNTYVHATNLWIVDDGGPLPQSGPVVAYDEQIGLTFVQNFPAISFNVTASNQTDSNQYGPAFLVNGLTDAGYWYQVGLAYDWPYVNGGYEGGFNFVYEVFDPNGDSVFPSSGGGGLSSFNGSVNNGDLVRLGLSFSGNNVTMGASDLTTGAAASQTYSNESASTFVGLTSSFANGNGYFSGLMTEWYHVNPYSGNEAQVTYFDNSSALTQAWMWTDEWDPSNPYWSGAWIAYTASPVQYGSNPNQLQEFSSHNATEYSDAYLFLTGWGCAMKTLTNGYFYIPTPICTASINSCLKIQELFNDTGLTGDQTGGNSPYPTIPNWPDGTVDMFDSMFISSCYGSQEGQTNWNYMADIVPDKVIDIYDSIEVSSSYGHTGTYITNLSNVTVTFNTGQNESPDSHGFVAIPQGAASFNVTKNGSPIGALITFWTS
jgi:hypothetical protein